MCESLSDKPSLQMNNNYQTRKHVEEINSRNRKGKRFLHRTTFSIVQQKVGENLRRRLQLVFKQGKFGLGSSK